MVIDSKFASEIVERTMKVINYNINVMDEKGQIIASGDKSRIGKVHEGALIAIQRNEVFEVTKETEESLSGVKEGVNLPIYYHDNIIGVIGITGNVNLVRQYGALVKMSAEIYVENLNLAKQTQFDKTVKTNFLNTIIKQDISDFSKLVIKYKMWEVKHRHYNCMSAIALVNLEDKLDALELITGVLDRANITFYTINENYNIVFLSSATNEKELQSKLSTRISFILKNIKKHSVDIVIATGKIIKTFDKVKNSYNSSINVLNYLINNQLYNQHYTYEELFNELLAYNVNSNWVIEDLHVIWNKLLVYDKHGELVSTLEEFVTCNGEIAAIAQNLNVHRNTVAYRLDKISSITDYDPRVFSSLYTLISARNAYKCKNCASAQ